MNIVIPGSELAADADGWARTPVWDYDEENGYVAEDRVGRAFGVRYTTMTRHLDVYLYVVVQPFDDGAHRYSVARAVELRETHGQRTVGIEIPRSWYSELEFTYPGKVDCDSAILPFQKARELALTDFRLDPWFPRITSLEGPRVVGVAD